MLKAPRGLRRAGHIHNKKAYLALWFWRMRTSQLHQLVKNKATETPHGVYYIHFSHSPLHLFAKELMVGTIYTHTWGFQRCSFRLTGQCEGLHAWNEHQDWLHVFLFVCKHHLKLSVKKELLAKTFFIHENNTYIIIYALSPVCCSEHGSECLNNWRLWRPFG